MSFELQVDGELVATLRFLRAFSSSAVAESADGCWAFERVGGWRPKVIIRACGSKHDTATFKANILSRGGTLTLADKRQLLASTNFWQTQYEISTPEGDVLLHFKRGRGLRLSATVEITPLAAGMPELPWLMVAGWYLSVLLHMDSGAATG